MPTADKANILLVDDEPEHLSALRALLEGADRQLHLAPDADSALRCAIDHDLALILLDVRMPGTDGFETAKMLRRIERSRLAPIVFLTTSADDPASVLRDSEVGAVDCLTKPLVPELLRAKVSVLIDLHRKNTALSREMAMRRSAERQVHESEVRLHALTSHFLTMREKERTAIAREIHDELGQVLTVLKMDIAWLARHPDDARLRVKTDAMCRLIDDTIRTVRKISAGLRPEVLDDMGLVSAIAWQTTEFQKRTGMRCRTVLPPETDVFDKDLSNTVFRIFQEILTNVARHAHATRLDVELRQSGDQLVLKVADNGVGIVLHEANARVTLGLLGMRERALKMRGTVEIEGAPGSGTRVRVSIPIPGPQRERESRRERAEG